MIKIGQDLWVNPAEVSHMRWERRFYMNGSDSALIISMRNGQLIRVEHGPGADAYKVEADILAATQK